MSSTSPNFNLILATSADVVAVDSQIANNFSTIDALFAVVHTGTGQFKAGLTLQTPTLSSPVITGTMHTSLLIASTGVFNTITATAGVVVVNTLTIGTYAYPTTIGTSGNILTVLTGNAVWVAPAPGTGANQGLSNLSSVAINTNLNTFTAGFVTLTRVIATSGALTGLTTFQASTGTFTSNLLVTGTLTAAVVNCTGGQGTFGGVTVGTWSLPSTLGSTGQLMRVAASTAGWSSPTTGVNFQMWALTAATVLSVTGGGSTAYTLTFDTIHYDGANQATTGSGKYTITASGLYYFSSTVLVDRTGTGAIQTILSYSGGIDTGAQGGLWFSGGGTTASSALFVASLIRATSGNQISAIVSVTNVNGSTTTATLTRALLQGYRVAETFI